MHDDACGRPGDRIERGLPVEYCLNLLFLFRDRYPATFEWICGRTPAAVDRLTDAKGADTV